MGLCPPHGATPEPHWNLAKYCSYVEILNQTIGILSVLLSHLFVLLYIVIYFSVVTCLFGIDYRNTLFK